MDNRPLVVLLDVKWAIRAATEHVVEILEEFPEYRHHQNEMVEGLILSCFSEVSLRAAASLPCRNSLPDSLARYIYSVPPELGYYLGRAIYRQERQLSNVIGEFNILDMRVKLPMALLELKAVSAH